MWSVATEERERYTTHARHPCNARVQFNIPEEEDEKPDVRKFGVDGSTFRPDLIFQ